MPKVVAERILPEPVSPPVVRLTLELTQVEAQALLYVIDQIGGTPEGVRGVFSGNPDSVYAQLRNVVGVARRELDTQYDIVRSGSSIYFNPR